MGKGRQIRRSDAREVAKRLAADPRMVASFNSEGVRTARPVPPPEPPMSPEEKQIVRLYTGVATNVWRMRRQILDAETGEPKEHLDGRAAAKLARYLASLEGALADAGVQVIGDYEGRPRDDGDAVKVVSYETRADLKCDTYIETLLPTVRWTNGKGSTRLLQQAETVVGCPDEAQGGNT